MGESVSDRVSLAFHDLSELDQNTISKYSSKAKVLDLSHNKFSDLRSLETFQNIDTLILDNNNLKSHVKFPSLPKIKILWVNRNRIANLTVFIETVSRAFPDLQYLSMINNPAAPSFFNGGSYEQYLDYRSSHYKDFLNRIATIPKGLQHKVDPQDSVRRRETHMKIINTNLLNDFKHYVISQLPKLTMLDDKDITISERQEGERIYKHQFSTKPSRTRRKSSGQSKRKSRSSSNRQSIESNVDLPSLEELSKR